MDDLNWSSIGLPIRLFSSLEFVLTYAEASLILNIHLISQ